MVGGGGLTIGRRTFAPAARAPPPSEAATVLERVSVAEDVHVGRVAGRLGAPGAVRGPRLANLAPLYFSAVPSAPPVRYRPVRTLADLNELSQAKATEGRSLDFKARVDGQEWWELAKDIAAFANHVGGTILVGAAEQPDGAAQFFGIDPGRGAELSTNYEMAARDKCKPRPLVDIEAIALNPGKAVLAVNVEPFPLGPVGAAFYVVGQDGKPASCDAWRFPVRVGKHNIPLQPDQIAMFMEPRIRRIVTLLEQAIAESNPATRMRAWIWTRSSVLSNNVFEIRESSVDVTRNAFVCVQSSTQLHIPFDDVEAVWARENGWHVRVSGYIDGDGVERHYVSTPSWNPR